MVGPCSLCGPYSQYCGHQSSGNYFWPMQYETTDYISSSYAASSSSSSSPSVDCTLSLGPPSNRLSNVDTSYETTPKHTTNTPHRNSVSSFCWDLLHPKHSSSSTPKTNSRTCNNSTPSNDPLFARRCANCDTTSTPLWRNGPRGPKSLCNACGIRFKKEERRAAAASTPQTTISAASGAAAMMDPHYGYYNGPWGSQGVAPQKMQCFGTPNEFRFMEDDRASDNGIQFVSWLTHDRPSGLINDFTR